MMGTKLYVSAYGTWGTEAVEIFDTSLWTSKDFDKLDAEYDFDKLELARKITKKRKKQAKKRLAEIRTIIL
jgi:hypothetical protein